MSESGSGSDSMGFCLLKRFVEGHASLLAPREETVPQKIALTAASEGITREEIEQMAVPLLAMWLYQQRAVSLGQALEWLGVGMPEFIRFIGEFGVAVVDLDAQELSDELGLIESILEG
jgi:hypothetical protein